MIGVVLLLTCAIAVTVGVVVASWPHCCQL